MNQQITDFETLVKISNDLKNAIQPQYKWVFENLSTFHGGHEFLSMIKTKLSNMFLHLSEISD